MQIKTAMEYGRRGWLLDNGVMSLFLMAGGGHIAGLRLHGKDNVNPFWNPPWKSIEPWQYGKVDARRYGAKLLASIFGHNICLSAFGDPSPEEQRCGLSCHYEAPVMRWSAGRRRADANGLIFEYGCNLPAAQMRLDRCVRLKAGSGIVRVMDTIRNLAGRDVPFTICQHVTLGPPFLEPGVTLFDLPSARAHTFPVQFNKPQRLQLDREFKWPDGPGKSALVNLRTAGKGVYGDFHTNLMNPGSPLSWFSAVNPRLGLMLAYAWQRTDYPWLGVWEESRARKQSPWNGKTLARGMEFANTPFPLGLRKAVDMNTFQGQRTYAWLPARGKITHHYALMLSRVESDCGGVANIVPQGDLFQVELLTGSRRYGRTKPLVVE